MSPVQIIRTVAAALIAGGGALGLVPSGSCGAGWWDPFSTEEYFGWYSLGEVQPGILAGTCGTAMAPVGSWALALIVVGVTLLAGIWLNTIYGPRDQPQT